MVNRGELYRIEKPTTRDPKKFRVFVVVSRQSLIPTNFSTLTCAPIYTNYIGLRTQVPVGVDEGLLHDSAIHCDELISIEKFKLTNFIGSLSESKILELNTALKIALELEN